MSNCCGAEMIPPDWEKAENSGSMWRAYVCYICELCHKACEPVDEGTVEKRNPIDRTRIPVSEKYPKVTRENIEKYLLEYQLEMVGKHLIDTLDDDKWYFNITMTTPQREAFRKHAIKTIQKVLKCNTTKAYGIFDHFVSTLGLRIKN